MISIFNYIDHTIVTQTLGNGQQVLNELDNQVSHVPTASTSPQLTDFSIVRENDNGTEQLALVSRPPTPRSAASAEGRGGVPMLPAPRSAASAEELGRSGNPNHIVCSQSEPSRSPVRSPVRSSTPEAFVIGVESDNHCTLLDWNSALELSGCPTPSSATEATQSYLRRDTGLPDGTIGLLFDPGSVGNLGGDAWCKGLASEGMAHGQTPAESKRERPLRVAGVGHGSQIAEYDCKLPISLKDVNGKFTTGTFTSPAIQHSDLPGLLGLASLERMKAVVDFGTRQLHIPGPGPVTMDQALPPGSTSYQMHKAPSGHLLLPCTYFSEGKKHIDMHTRPEEAIALIAQSEPSSPYGIDNPDLDRPSAEDLAVRSSALHGILQRETPLFTEKNDSNKE